MWGRGGTFCQARLWTRFWVLSALLIFWVLWVLDNRIDESRVMQLPLTEPVRIRPSSHELPPSAVILWIELGGKPKWLPLIFGYHDVMWIFYEKQTKIDFERSSQKPPCHYRSNEDDRFSKGFTLELPSPVEVDLFAQSQSWSLLLVNTRFLGWIAFFVSIAPTRTKSCRKSDHKQMEEKRSDAGWNSEDGLRETWKPKLQRVCLATVFPCATRRVGQWKTHMPYNQASG